MSPGGFSLGELSVSTEKLYINVLLIIKFLSGISSYSFSAIAFLAS